MTARVIATHNLRIEATAGKSIPYDTGFITWDESHMVFEERHDFAPDSEHQTRDAPDDIIRLISILIHLPKGVDACSQSYRSRNITFEPLFVHEADFFWSRRAAFWIGMSVYVYRQ
jgi:hypothetical protein